MKKFLLNLLSPLNVIIFNYFVKQKFILFCGGGNTTIVQPDPINPSAEQGKYLFGSGFENYQGVTDPRLQERIIAAEEQFRPRYAALELADIETFTRGIEGGKDSEAYRLKELQLEGLRKAKEAGGAGRAVSIDDEIKAILGPKPKRPTSGKNASDVHKRNMAAYNKRADTLRRALSSTDSSTDLDARIASVEGELTLIGEGKGQAGLFDLLEESGRRASAMQRESLAAQRAEDVSALQQFAPQVVEAYRMADPTSARLADLQAAQAERLFAEAEGPLSPERRRMAEQQARAGSLARGRIGDESSVASEILGREQFRSGLRQEARQAGQLGFAQSRSIAGDIGASILGRPSQGLALGGNVLGQAQAQAAGPMGPQLFDPNVGINLALQQRAQDIEFQGAQAAAAGAASGGRASGLGYALGGLFQMCWVAREVYGVTNPRWLQFRQWMFEESPTWFFNLYVKHGEKFAQFISNKPFIKNIIRQWMDSRIS